MPAAPVPPADVAFDPPGPGFWALDRSHFPGGVTPIGQWLLRHGMPAGTRKVFAEMGAPIDCIDTAFVHGFNYTRIRPLIGADKPPRPLPPTFLLKVVSHLHPEFRRRAKRAHTTIHDRPFLDVLERWNDDIRPRLVADNRAFQAIDLASLADDELDGHLGRLLDHCHDRVELHFWLHGHDLGGIARLVSRCADWGIPADEVAPALAGASPSTSRPAEMLARLRALVDTAGVEAVSLDAVRAASPDAAALLDEYLADRSHVLATGYDLSSLTLGELPGAIAASIRSAAAPNHDGVDAITAALRERVPPDGRAEFDGLLADARAVMDMRDDNGPLTVQWPIGLLRRAMLEAGRRLAAGGALTDPEHVLELEPDEARRAMAGPRPTARELADRAERRAATATLDPPVGLGQPEPEPPLEVLPAPLPDLVRMVRAVMSNMGMDAAEAADPMVGVGVGTAAYTGPVCTAASADEAIEKLEPGDVLVVRATSPSFNVVLPIAGAIVTSSGGALSHAAVLARELGIPAVVGAPGALSITDGATVTVDPIEGRVQVVDARPDDTAD